MSDQQLVKKAGLQSDDDPFTFVMSTPSRDRQGDVVEQDWRLAEFRRNPIALFGHQSNALPIGTWENVKVTGGRLMGRLKLAEKGTSEFIDTLRSLVEQRILKAVSVGFLPGKADPLDEDNPWGGMRLSKNVLMETSLVNIPANPEALSLAKSLGAESRRMLFESEPHAFDCAAKQLGIPKSQVSDTPTPKPTSTKRNSAMSLAQKIEAAQTALSEQKDLLLNLTETGPTEDTTAEEHDEQVDEVTQTINAKQAELDRLIKAENALAEKTIAKRESVVEKSGEGSDSYDTRGPGKNLSARRVPQEKGKLVLQTMAYMLKGHSQRMSPLDVMGMEKPEDAQELEILIRAASNPADRPTAAWAGNLVQQRWAEFVDLLLDVAVYPQLPGYRLEFGRNEVINVPKNDGRGTLAGGFVGEGVPIPVKEGIIGTVDLAAKKMAVISSFTKEIGRHSTPAVESIIRSQILSDTAEALDTLLLDAGARTAIRPAGYQDPTETGAGNIVAATAATVAGIIADTQAMISRMMAARVSTTAVWIMNPINVLYLRNIQDAASGAFPFRAEVSAGSFMGYPVIQSQHVPVNTAYLQGNGVVAYGNDIAPMIEVSDEATLVFDDTAPEHIVDGGTATTMPTKSLFQMDAVALKMTQGLDWRIIRPGGIQVLTGVSWG